RTLGLREMLQVYLDHRIEVTTRRSRFRLARSQARLHLVDGLLVAILDIDEVIQVIRPRDDSDQARKRLTDVFDLSQVQSEYILELRLRRLTRFSRIELEAERDQLRTEIAELELLLSDPVRVRHLVSHELEEVAEKYGTPRRTMLTHARPSVATTGSSKKQAPILEHVDVPCEVILSTTGRVIRVDLSDEADAPPRAPRRSKHDAIRATVQTTSRTEIGAVTSTGRVVRLSPIDLP